MKQCLSGLWTEFCPPGGLQCLVRCMSAPAECLARLCGTLNRSWEVSLQTPWGPGPILPARKNLIKEEEESARIRDAFRGLWETHFISAQLLRSPV